MAMVDVTAASTTTDSIANSPVLEKTPRPKSLIVASGLDPKWPTLEATAKYIKRAGWQRSQLPSELNVLPNDLHIPDKLRQILDWSILPGTEWATTPPSESIDEADEDDEGGECASQLEAPSDYDNSSVTDAMSLRPSDSKSVRSSHSHNHETLTHVSPSTKVDKPRRLHKLFGKLGQTRKKSAARPMSIVRPPTPIEECTSCMDEFPTPELARIEACRHWYCKPCLNRLITTAMSTETSFPPKCCLSPIPIHTVLLSLTEEQRTLYQSKSAEYALAPADRWYCPRATCAQWIPPTSLQIGTGFNYTCPHCSESICRTCRGVAHPANTECPQDFGLEATLETAELEGWRRCHSCRAMVEHNLGCRHMTCRCRAEFCYVCGAVWQTCRCTEQDATRRRTELQQRREERLAAAAAEAEEIARAVAEVAEMERAAAEARRVEEERQAREEEERLAALERERQAEEAAKLAAAEEEERQWYEAIKTSFDDDCAQMETLLDNILGFQQAQLNIRHETENSARETELAFHEMGSNAKYEALLRNVKSRYVKQRESLRAQQKQEMEALEEEHEDEEDSFVVANQKRLKGKPNREARMEKMLTELRKNQEEATEDLIKTHTQALYTLEVRRRVDLNGINNAQEEEANTSQLQLEQKSRKLGYTVGSDRRWFELVAERRLAMLARHREVGLEDIERREEPRGLQDWQAVTCAPVLPDAEVDEAAINSTRTSGYELGISNVQVPPKIELRVSSSTRTARGSQIHELSGPSVRHRDSRSDQREREQSNSKSYFSEDAYLQPVSMLAPPGHAPPTPPSSSVSIEASHIRTASIESGLRPEEPRSPLSRTYTGNSSDTVSIRTSNSASRTQSRSQVLLTGDLYTSAFLGAPQAPGERKSIASTTVSSVDSNDRKQSSTSTTAKTKRKSIFGFGKKKELTPEEIRQLMKHAVGDAR